MARTDVKPLLSYSGRVEPWLQAERLERHLLAIAGAYRTLADYGPVAEALVLISEASGVRSTIRQEQRLNTALNLVEESVDMETKDFGWALNQLRAGGLCARAGWNGPDQHLELQVPDEHSKMTLPYIFITTVQGDLVPWLASQTDMLADDWYAF